MPGLAAKPTTTAVTAAITNSQPPVPPLRHLHSHDRQNFHCRKASHNYLTTQEYHEHHGQNHDLHVLHDRSWVVS